MGKCNAQSLYAPDPTRSRQRDCWGRARARKKRADLSNFTKACNPFPWAPVPSKNKTSIHSLICCLVENRKLKKENSQHDSLRSISCSCSSVKVHPLFISFYLKKTKSREWLFDPIYQIFWGFRHGIGLLSQKNRAVKVFSTSRDTLL